MRDRWAAAAVAALFIGLVLVTLWPALVGGKVFGPADDIFLFPPFSGQAPAGWKPSNPLLTDPLGTFVPGLQVARAAVRSGILPLWNPYLGAGRPYIFMQQAPLYPVNWLAFVLPFWHSLGWIAAGKLLLAMFGAYLFCRDLGLRRGPAALAGVVFPFSSYFFVWLEHPHTNVWATLPWMFLGARRVCTRGTFGGAAILGTAGGLACVADHPESTSIVFAATFAYGLFELLSSRREATRPVDSTDPPGPGARMPMVVRLGSVPTFPGRVVLFFAALLLGLGLGAIMILPFREALDTAPYIQRGGGNGTGPLQFLWTFAFPELWGSPAKAYSAGLWNFNERTTYFGAVPLLLAAGTLGRRRPRQQWFFIGLCVVVLISIFNTPVWAYWIANLPGVRLVWLARTRVLLSFAGAVLAAYGLQRWLDGSARERQRMLWLMGITALVPVLVWVPGHTGILSHLGSAVQQLPAVHPSQPAADVVALGSVWRWALICGLAVSALWLLRRRPGATAVIVTVIALTAADLVTLDHNYHGAVPLAQAVPPPPSTIRYLETHQGDARVTGSLAALPSDLEDRYGLRDPEVGFDIPPLRYSSLWNRLGAVGGGGSEVFNASAPGGQRLANLFAVRYVLVPPGEPVPTWLHTVLTTAGGTVAYNPTALPRTWIAYEWQAAPSRAEALSRTLSEPPSQLLDRPVIEGTTPSPNRSSFPPSSAQVVQDQADAVTIDAVARRRGYLVLDDSAYPGWSATVDGHAVAWRAANENFRAVPVPAGRHVIRFSYRPSSVLVGGIISCISLLMVITLTMLALLARRRRVMPRPRTLTAAHAG